MYVHPLSLSLPKSLTYIYIHTLPHSCPLQPYACTAQSVMKHGEISTHKNTKTSQFALLVPYKKFVRHSRQKHYPPTSKAARLPIILKIPHCYCFLISFERQYSQSDPKISLIKGCSKVIFRSSERRKTI